MHGLTNIKLLYLSFPRLLQTNSEIFTCQDQAKSYQFLRREIGVATKQTVSEKGQFIPIHTPQSFVTVHKNTILVTDTWFCLVDFRFRLW
jgi:hypothetical protein